MLKPAAAGLAVSSLCLSFLAEIPAQTGSKKKPAMVQAQGQAPANDDTPAPRKRTAVDSDPNAGEKSAETGTKTGKLPRPEPQVLHIPKVAPELEKVLQDWERHTSQFKKLVGDFTVIKYETTFEIEKRGEGKFAHEAPDKGNYERKGMPITKGQKAQKKNKDGEPYSLQSDSPERWVCTGKEVIQIFEKEKTYERFPIPPEAQGENIIEGPLPFLFGMKTQQAKMRYKMEILKQDDSEIKLQVIPIRRSDAVNWDRATIIIDAKLFVPKAVKLFDPTGNETVHLFHNVEINPKSWFDRKDLFKPNLKGYKEVVRGESQSASAPSKSNASKSTASKSGAATESPKRTTNSTDAPARKNANLK
jgi:TIGR03009 family protein